MSIRVHNFAGVLGWNARKYLPRLSSESYLKLQFVARRRQQKKYIDYFYSQKETPHPVVVNLETVNRCNSTCEFCTANINAEKRPYMKIDENLYYSIIDQLRDWGYKGHLTLYGNNEPWLDKRIVEFHKYARKQLPEAFIFMSTNGLLLDVDKVKAIVPHLDQLIINNYCLNMKMHDNVQVIYEYVKAHPQEVQRGGYPDPDPVSERGVDEPGRQRAEQAVQREGDQGDVPDALYRYVDHAKRQDGYLLLR